MARTIVNVTVYDGDSWNPRPHTAVQVFYKNLKSQWCTVGLDHSGPDGKVVFSIPNMMSRKLDVAIHTGAVTEDPDSLSRSSLASL
jgi:hypothetical protein